jgi:hypothetical protein
MNYIKNYLDYVDYVRNLTTRGLRPAHKKDRSKFDGYYEFHHVVPLCVGGEDVESNLVALTAREHFLAHYLLCKVYRGRGLVYYKLLNAFEALCNFKNTKTRTVVYRNSRLYEKLKTEIAKKTSEQMKGNKFNLGRKQPLEEIDRRRRSNTGKKRTSEQTQRMRDSFTPERREESRKRGKKNGIPVECLNTSTVFENASEAARLLGVSQGNLTSVCTGHRDNVRGLRFRKREDLRGTDVSSEGQSFAKEKQVMREFTSSLPGRRRERFLKVQKRHRGADAGRARRVIRLDDLTVFDCIEDADKSIERGSVSKSCQMNKKEDYQRAGGFFWAYFEFNVPLEEYSKTFEAAEKKVHDSLSSSRKRRKNARKTMES